MAGRVGMSLMERHRLKSQDFEGLSAVGDTKAEPEERTGGAVVDEDAALQDASEAAPLQEAALQDDTDDDVGTSAGVPPAGVDPVGGSQVDQVVQTQAAADEEKDVNALTSRWTAAGKAMVEKEAAKREIPLRDTSGKKRKVGQLARALTPPRFCTENSFTRQNVNGILFFGYPEMSSPASELRGFFC
eukprot:TRINITY_DN4420_c0_g3_i1.p2 TRINITY_DN4420_c0_g3~~TRINITY_DN4420_c0_g3_i1.p2  ORF type:complete len:188 (-),score=4.47 TRINITY_DN4420_c0_g3_i1:209-772(-)